MSQKIYTDLEVKGSVTISTINNATTDTDRFLVSDAGTIKYRTGTEMLSDLGAQSILTNPITGTGTTNYVSKFTGTTTLGNSQIFDNGTEVGINTASPGYKLDVNGTGRFSGNLLTNARFGAGSINLNSRVFASAFSGELATAIFTTFDNSASTQEAVRFSTADLLTGAVRIYPRVGAFNYNGITVADSAVIVNLTTKPLLIGVQDGSAIQFTTTDTIIGTNNSEKVRITSAGNVGIGTPTPQSKLHVAGDGITLTTGSNNFGFIKIETVVPDSFNYPYEGDLVLSSNNFNGTYSVVENMRIVARTGNIGIGTAIPSQKLHVSGSIRVDGAIYDSTNSPGTSGQVLTSTVTGNSWSTLSSIGGLPPGGTAGQILTKVDATDYNATWQENYADWTSVVKHIVKNNGAALITKGTPVYSTGSNGTNILVGKASNTSEATSSKTMGLMQSDITTTGGTQTGFVVTEGLLGGLNTAGQIAGDPVWLGPTGTLIYGLINKPYAPAHLVFIGIVTKVSAGNGEIFVKVQNGFELEELHNVDLVTTTPISGHLLGFNGTLWVNKTIAGWLGYTPANANGTINQVAKFTGTTTLGDSSIFDNTTNVGINTISGFLGYTQITSANSLVSPGGGGGAFTATSQLMLASNSNSAINAGGVINFGGKYNTLQAYVGFGRIGGRKENATNSNIAGYLNFEVAENSNGGFLERMRISSLGNVGIGTIAPTQRLHVVGRMILDNGQESSYIGTNSGIADLATTFTRNVGVGARTFQNNITGAKNVAVGVSALQASLGDDNVAIGFETLKTNTVASNSALGYQALTAATTAAENTAIGKFALREILTGGFNTALGYAAGRFISTGTSNSLTTYSLFLGHSTRPLNNSDTNTIVIGASAVGIGPNTAVLGNDSIITTALKGNVGIGTTAPAAKLDVQGSIFTRNAIYFGTVAGSAVPFCTLGLNGSGDLVFDDAISAQNFIFSNSGNVFINNSGQVTIGTTDVGLPAYGLLPQLTVASATGGVLDIRNTNTSIAANTSFGRIQFTGKSDQIAGYTAAAIEAISNGTPSSGSNGGGILKLMTSTSGYGTSPLERMRISSLGDVGIGTISPGFKLEVNGTAYASSDFRAPVFYDSNNTGYYLDPASTSVLNRLSISFNDATYLSGIDVTNTNTGAQAIAGLSMFSGAHNGSINMFSSGYMDILNQNTTNGAIQFRPRATVSMNIDNVSSTSRVTIGSNNTASHPLRVTQQVSNVSIYADYDIVAYSDQSVKENIRPIENVLDRVNKSRGVVYDRIDSGEKNNIGFIAQELEVEFPELVVTNEDNTKAVKYQNAVAVLFEAVKEQQKQIEELKELVNKVITK